MKKDIFMIDQSSSVKKIKRIKSLYQVTSTVVMVVVLIAVLLDFWNGLNGGWS